MDAKDEPNRNWFLQQREKRRQEDRELTDAALMRLIEQEVGTQGFIFVDYEISSFRLEYWASVGLELSRQCTNEKADGKLCYSFRFH